MENNITYFEVKKIPIVVIDDVFTENELEDIMNELQFLSKNDKLMDPDHTGTARFDDGTPKKKNKGVFLKDLFRGEFERFSDILRLIPKVSDNSYVDEFEKYHRHLEHFREISNWSALLSYYENKSSYGAHNDDSRFTVLNWFYKTPKKFKGGDIIFEDELKIECQNNRVVIFPSFLLHEVTEVTMKEIDLNKGLGRFVVTLFLNM